MEPQALEIRTWDQAFRTLILEHETPEINPTCDKTKVVQLKRWKEEVVGAREVGGGVGCGCYSRR